MIDKLMENIAHKDRTITQLIEEKQALIVDYLAHERRIAGQEAELARLRAVNTELTEILRELFEETRPNIDVDYRVLAKAEAILERMEKATK